MDDWEPPLDRPPAPARSKVAPVALIVAAAALAAGAAYWLFARPAAAPVTSAALDADAPDASAPTLSLADGEVLLRRLVAELSSSAELKTWLETPDILRRIAAAVRLVAEGRSPRPVLPFLELQGELTVTDALAGRPHKRPRKGPVPVVERLLITDASYARYDLFGRVLGQVDAAALGRAYAQVRPYFDQAFAEVAREGERFDQPLTQALSRLARAPIPEGPVEVVGKGALYAFKDPALEALSDAEKHVLRMGPKNGRALQEAARRFAEGAGLTLTP